MSIFLFLCAATNVSANYFISVDLISFLEIKSWSYFCSDHRHNSLIATDKKKEITKEKEIRGLSFVLLSV
jgi:hypothetical protein